jgi:hypothetical protein
MGAFKLAPWVRGSTLPSPMNVFRFLRVVILMLGSAGLLHALEVEVAPPGHKIIVLMPAGWNEPLGVTEPLLVAAVDPSTGRSFGVLGIRQRDISYRLNRKTMDAALLEELGPEGKILRRLETTLVGVPAYGVIAETREDGHRVSILRIMAEKPLNGFVYGAQSSKLGGGDFNKDEVQDLTRRVKVQQEIPQFRS